MFEFRANLSNDYFTNRQDRYIIFEDCPELSNYYDELVKRVSSFSFQLNEDNRVILNPVFNMHPYKSSKKDFNQAAGNLIEKFAKQYTNISFQKQTISKILITDSEDTLVFPLLQMKTFGIDQDEQVTSNILRSDQSNCCICLATAYFNVTDDYWKALLQGCGQVNVVMAHPKSMGFYKAPGVAGIWFPADNYMFKVNSRNTGTRCKICSELVIKTPEQRHSVVLVSLLLILNIFHTLLQSLLLTLNIFHILF